MSTKVLEVHKSTINRVVDENYYLEHFQEVSKRYPEIHLESDPRVIQDFWDEYWFSLPDTPEIHDNTVFYDICDLAAGDVYE